MQILRRAALLNLALLAMLVACRDPAPAVSPSREISDKPDIFIVVMDTTRWDHMSLNGYGRPTTPFLESIAPESLVYDNARASSAWTVPSHASLLTGLDPNRHHATQSSVDLSSTIPYLAEILSAEGYGTVGIVENPQLTRQRGFARGFESYHEVFRGGKLEDDPRITPKLLRAALQSASPEQPVFCFINLIAPHSPYGAPKIYREAFGSPLKQSEHPNQWHDFYAGTHRPDEKELELLKLEYDAEVRFTDYLVQQIWSAIKSLREPENTLLVITSDHGENFGDHGHLDHVFCLYDTLIHVPLLIRYPPGIEPGRSSYPAHLTDVVPTALSIAGVQSSEFEFDGLDLQAIDPSAKRPQISEYYYPEQALRGFSEEEKNLPRMSVFKRHLRSVVKNQMKFVWASEGRMELFDLKTDPGEETNLIDHPDYQESRSALEQILEKYAEKGTPAPLDEEDSAIGTEDPETLEQLKKLGYL